MQGPQRRNRADRKGMNTLVFASGCALRNVRCSDADSRKYERKVQQPPARKYSVADILSGIRAFAGEEGSCPTFRANNKKSGWLHKPVSAGKVRAMKVENLAWQAMRGSALRASGRAETPCVPRRLARGYPAPLHPRSGKSPYRKSCAVTIATAFQLRQFAFFAAQNSSCVSSSQSRAAR